MIPMTEIPIGAKAEKTLLVTSDLAINFMGIEAARVLATPHLVGHLEYTSRDAVLPYLEPGYDCVGTHVEVHHLAATPMGMSVTFRAEITSVEGRRVNFKVEAFDEKEKIAEGTHQRFIVNAARFAARVQEKSAGTRITK